MIDYMDYVSARDHIKTGDLIAVKRTDGWFWKLARCVTKSEVTHTAIAIWLDDGLYAAEMHWGGNHLVPLSQYTADFDVYRCPVDGQIRDVILSTLRKRITYDFADLLWIGLCNLCHLKSPRDTGGFVCSTFSAHIYRMAGYDGINSLPRIPSPGDLANLLWPKRIEVSVQ